MKHLLPLFCLFLSMCATTTEGLTKDQIAAREKSRSAWSAFGLGAANVALNLGLSYANASRGDQQLPSGKGFRK